MLSIDESEKFKTVVENKDYIAQLVNTVSKSMIEAFENLKIEDVNMFQLGYNKALDDFVKLAKEHNWNIRNRNENEFIYGAIDRLAEQLKAGGNS